MKIVEYKFNSSKDTLPTFNADYTYTTNDVVNSDGTTTRIIESDVLPTDISFMSCTGLLEIIDVNMSNVTSAYGMFYKCSNVTSINLGDYDTPNLESTEGMFNSCYKLKNIIFGNFNTNNVNNMGGMFSDCREIECIDVNKINVSNNTNFGAMFRRCYKLTNLDLNNWDVSKGVLFSTMLSECNLLNNVKIDKWILNNTTKVDFSSLFYKSSKLLEVKMPNITNYKISLQRLFYHCTGLKKVDFNNSKLNMVESMEDIFTGSNNIDTIILNNSDYNSVNCVLSLLPKIDNQKIYAYNCDNVELINEELATVWDISIGKGKSKPTFKNNRGVMKFKGKSIVFMAGEKFI